MPTHRKTSRTFGLASMLFVALAGAVVPPTPSPLRAQTPADPPTPGDGLRPGEVPVIMRTDAGDIHLAIDTVAAPLTGANFLRYVDASLYAGGTFYRAVRPDNQPGDDVRIDVIQGGMDRARRRQALPAIALESTGATGLRHLDGTLSMARSGPDTARAEFFICIGPQPALDEGGARNPDGRGFAAFGRVSSGMDVVRAIHARAVDGQALVKPVVIRGVERLRPPGPTATGSVR